MKGILCAYRRATDASAPTVDVYVEGSSDPLYEDVSWGDTGMFLEVPEGSSAIGQKVSELDDVADDDAAVIGLVRRGRRLPGTARNVEIRQGDLLVDRAQSGALGIENRI